MLLEQREALKKVVCRSFCHFVEIEIPSMLHLDDLDSAKKIAQNFLTMIFTNQEVVAGCFFYGTQTKME